jgi:YD repeat-containing protein
VVVWTKKDATGRVIEATTVATDKTVNPALLDVESTAGDAGQPQVAYSAAAGQTLITWRETGFELHGRVLDNTRTLGTAFQLTGAASTNHALAASPIAGWVATWSAFDEGERQYDLFVAPVPDNPTADLLPEDTIQVTDEPEAAFVGGIDLRTDGGVLLLYEDDPPTSPVVTLLVDAGNLSTIPTVEQTYTWHYEYDDLGRLTSACSLWDDVGETCDFTNGGQEWLYSYDGGGNLTMMSTFDMDTGEVTNLQYIYNGANQITCKDGNINGQCGDPEDVAYTYDAYGNLRYDGETLYTYDAANRLAQVCPSTDGSTCSGPTTTYTYNGDGDRIAQEVVDSGVTTTTTYVLDVAVPLTMVLGLVKE